MIYEAKGNVIEVGETKVYSEKFKKRQVIVDIAEPTSKYPNPVSFIAVKDGCSALDGIVAGSSVSIRFAIDGRKWDGPKGVAYFTDLKIVKIESEGCVNAAPVVQEDADADPTEMPF